MEHKSWNSTEGKDKRKKLKEDKWKTMDGWMDVYCVVCLSAKYEGTVHKFDQNVKEQTSRCKWIYSLF